jgi:tetratricopeptide (TPR) repeat protein
MQLNIGAVLEIEAVRTGEVPLLEHSEEFQLIEMVEGGGEAARAWSQQVEVTGSHSIAGISASSDLPPAVSAWEEFARAYALLPAPDMEVRRTHCHRIAEIWRDGAGLPDRAFDALRWALEMDVNHEPTRALIEEVAREAEMLEDLAESYINVLELIHGIDSVVFLNQEAARLLEEIGQIERAEHHFNNILSVKPDHKPAFEALQRIYRNSERWEDLAALDERQMEDLMDQLPAGPEREEKLRELATLYEEKLDQPYEAMEAWSRLLTDVPDDLEAHRAMARLAQKTGSWSKAVEALNRIE